MTAQEIYQKVKNRLNKGDSSDYDNIPPQLVVEAWNKAQREYLRDNLRGNNIYKEGDEESITRVDDFQILITKKQLALKKHKLYYETENIPTNYFRYKRIDLIVEKGKCVNISPFKCDLIEESNVNDYLIDENKSPSFSWRETFCSLSNNKFSIYTGGDFNISSAYLFYYREPVNIDIYGYTHQDNTPSQNIDPEFKNDVCESITDGAVAILAGDIESPNQMQIATQTQQIKN